jgi:hypothetical protein
MHRHSSPRLLLAGVSLFLAFVFSIPVFAQKYGDLPLSFEPNLGQTNSKVRFLSHGNGYGFFLSGDSATLQLGANNPHTVELTVANGQAPAQIVGEAPLPGTVNYFRGPDESRWLRNVPTYARVRMTGVYPGVDLVYYGNHRQLEYDFVVHPDADAARVALTQNGADALKLSDDGSLLMQVALSTLLWHAPVAYQDIDGHRYPVSARYEIAGSTIAFRLGEYDHAHDLVIDPVLIYSTYLGGNGGADGDTGNAIAADSAGSAYVAGIASSTDFPTSSTAVQPAAAGNDDAFVAKLNPQGTAFIYSTYLGGGGQDIAWGIAIDSAGEAFVTGQTGSGLHGAAPFPTTAGAYQRTPNPATLNNSAFITKLSADGSNLLYSTYLSGANDSFATGIAVDPAGDAYVVTNTASGFPVSSGAYQEAAGTDSCPYEQFADGQAQAVTELNPDGSALVYSTYLGHGCDYGSGIAVNSSGEAYITGYTQDSTYPITTGAAQSKFGGVVDAFVTKLNAAGNGLMYSTFLGGSLADFGYGIALDPSGYAYVTGATDGNFPTTSGAYVKSATNNGNRKGFVTKMSPLGKAFVYSTYVVGAGNVSFNAIAVDKGNNAHVTGYTDGKQYPVTSNAVQGTCYASSTGCLTQAVVTKLNPTGSALVYSSYFGASDSTNTYFPGNIGNGIAVDNAGGFYITGRTSNGLKTTSTAVEPTYRATSTSSDAFVAKFNIDGTTTTTTTVTITSPENDSTMTSTSVNVSGSASGGDVGWMQIYVDGVRKLQVAGSTIHDTLTLAAGQHRITVQAIDKDGSVAKSTVNVTIK